MSYPTSGLCWVVKQPDESRQSTTALTADAQLQAVLTANLFYPFRFYWYARRTRPRPSSPICRRSSINSRRSRRRWARRWEFSHEPAAQQPRGGARAAVNTLNER